MAPHSRTLAWKIPWTEGPGGLQVHGVPRSRTRLSDFTLFFHFHALEKEMATHFSVLVWRIPGMGSLVGCRLQGCTESDTTEATQQQHTHTQLIYIYTHNQLRRIHIYICICVCNMYIIYIYIYTHTHTHTHICMYASQHCLQYPEGITGKITQMSRNKGLFTRIIQHSIAKCYATISGCCRFAFTEIENSAQHIAKCKYFYAYVYLCMCICPQKALP